MFRQLVWLQWRIIRWTMFPVTLLAFAAPLLILRYTRTVLETDQGTVSTVLNETRATTGLFVALAIFAGLTMGLSAWNWDHKGNHVYALSLPVPRWQYALLKMGAGALPLLAPALALLAGCLVGLGMTSLPPGVQAYPWALTTRFLFASLIIYGAAFALAAGTIRTTAIIMIGFITLLVGGELMVQFLESETGRQMTSPGEFMVEAFVSWPGPLRVFSGNWMLIDV